MGQTLGDPSRPGLSYDCPGATAVAQSPWPPTPAGLRRHETSAVIGHGDRCWDESCDAIVRWAVKRRSGFRIDPVPVIIGQDLVVRVRIGPVTIHEPVRVIELVTTVERVGFSYGTRPGHPVAGEESFVVTRDSDGMVRLELRSLTGAAPGWRQLLFPAALALQGWYRRRYLAALAPQRSARRDVR